MNPIQFKTHPFIVITALWLVTCFAKAQDNTVTPVITATAVNQEFYDVVEALGTLKANNSVTITSTVTELVTEVHFSDGERVKRGDLLVTMDTSDEQALLQEEQARVGEARRLVKRLKPLAAQNATSKSALDAQNSIVSVAEARIRGIKSQIDKRLIKAPFDGVLGLLDISVGTLAQPGIELATLDDDVTMKMDFSVPERHLSYLSKGLKIEAQTLAFPDQKFSGVIASINSRINPVTRSVVVRAIIENPNQLLKPGILMRIQLATQPRTSLLIPEEAITASTNEQKVFKIVNDNQHSTVAETQVTIGTRYGGKLEIHSGLDAGDQVVIHGTLKIKDGDPVEVVADKKNKETLVELLAEKKTSQSATEEGI
ncbi:efflux RND transporter periplasmic adaptor subunit [Marinicella litoralis]|uniref:Membrane fusion protein (Multidrug efflux system) n=1 Tax=Marinicella litoralis TaxID=644220 RepID=A0A4V3DIS3_9GAMM|nr:efflux RND transporter periplasmic adaptor subunit [Marinicella litoralis]TDR23361.1 membrane fusion protein (multidrug efflux system) [Marinicella litoralis]